MLSLQIYQVTNIINFLIDDQLRMSEADKLTEKIHLKEFNSSPNLNKHINKIYQSETPAILHKSKKNQISKFSDIKNESIIETILQESTEDNQQTLTISPKNSKPAKRKLTEIEIEKQKIIKSINEVKEQISIIKNQSRSNSQLYKRQLIAKDKQAQRNAEQLVNYYKQKKKELEEKKKCQAYKIVINLRNQYEQSKKKRESTQNMLRTQKRNEISFRLNQIKKNKQKTKAIDRETNSFINRMLKEEKSIEQQKINMLKKQSNHKIKTNERSPQMNHLKLQEHEISYLINKDKDSLIKKQKSVSINYPIRSYQKSKWTEQLEELSQRDRDMMIIKEINKKLGRKKRFKYGELVNNLFSQKKRVRTEANPEQKEVSSSFVENSKSIQLRPQMSDNRGGSQSTMKRQTQSVVVSNFQKKNPLKAQEDHRTPQLIQSQKKRKQRQYKIRLETKQRMKRIENKFTKEQSTKYKSSYQNYLGIFKVSERHDSDNWSQIMNNDSIIDEEKYQKMLKKAEALQNKAKLKESVRRKSNYETDDLFMNSIQAKLMILQHL